MQSVNLGYYLEDGIIILNNSIDDNTNNFHVVLLDSVLGSRLTAYKHNNNTGEVKIAIFRQGDWISEKSTNSAKVQRFWKKIHHAKTNLLEPGTWATHHYTLKTYMVSLCWTHSSLESRTEVLNLKLY